MCERDLPKEVIIDPMSDGTTIKRVLQDCIESIDKGQVMWVAISTRYISGSTLAVHSNGAPKRPRGMS